MILRLHQTRSISRDFSGPAWATLAGAAASGLLYYLVRRKAVRLEAIGEKLRGWLPQAKRTAIPAAPAAPVVGKPIADRVMPE